MHMKTKMIIGLALLIGGNAFAQEFDDMYFRSKDREKLQLASKNSNDGNYQNFKKKHFDEETELDTYANPTDSYSARNVNPEFIARSNSEKASEDESNYFVENYNSDQKNIDYSTGYYTNNLNNQLYNPYYTSGWFGPSYYGSMYNPYSYYGGMDPYLSPYWYGSNSGWSMSANYFWGMNSGWNFGLGYTWGNPYYGNSWGSSWYNPYCRPYTTVVVVNEGSRPNYGKRPTHNSAGVTSVNRSNYYKTTTSGIANNDTRGRISKSSNEYYVRPSRRIYSDTNSSYNSSQGSSSFRSFNNSGSKYNSSGYSSPSRGSSNMGSMSSPTRSSSGSSGSSGSSSSGSRRGN